jgi:hypothetical protein
MALTTDPNDPRLDKHDNEPDPQSGQDAVYLVLSDDELAKGFVRPVRRTYIHSTCQTATTMGQKLAETYAAKPTFYGSTYCVMCGGHFPVSGFYWADDETVVGS